MQELLYLSIWSQYTVKFEHYNFFIYKILSILTIVSFPRDPYTRKLAGINFIDSKANIDPYKF